MERAEGVTGGSQTESIVTHAEIAELNRQFDILRNEVKRLSEAQERQYEELSLRIDGAKCKCASGCCSK